MTLERLPTLLAIHGGGSRGGGGGGHPSRSSLLSSNAFSMEEIELHF